MPHPSPVTPTNTARQKGDQSLHQRLSRNPLIASIGASLVARLDPVSGGIFLHDQGGILITRPEAEELFHAMQVFFDFHSDEAVLDHNAEQVERLNHHPAPSPDKVKENKAYPGYVYVVKGAGDIYKIGMTRAGSAEERFKAIDSMIPGEAQLLWFAYVDNVYEAERNLHQRFAQQRVKGEWFRLDNEDVDSITRTSVS